MDEEMDMVVFSVEFYEFCTEIGADFFENISHIFEVSRSKDATSVFCNEDQMDMEGENAMTTASISVEIWHKREYNFKHDTAQGQFLSSLSDS